MAIVLAFIENHKNPAIDGLCEEYEKKTKGIFSFKRKKLAGAKGSNPKKQQEEETKKITGLKKTGDILILCDERGKSFDSVELSKYFEKHLMQTSGDIILAIGGAYGFTQEALHKNHRIQKQMGIRRNHACHVFIAMHGSRRVLFCYCATGVGCVYLVINRLCGNHSI